MRGEMFFGKCVREEGKHVKERRNVFEFIFEKNIHGK